MSDKKKKKKVSVYLDRPYDFISEMGKPSALINYLLEKEFGPDYSDDPVENEQFKIKKTLMAREILLANKPGE